MARTRTKAIRNLTPEEYRACYSLNLRDGGLMRGQLQDSYRRGESGVYASMIFNEDGRLDAWALTFPDRYYKTYRGETLNNAYFYVRKTMRRHGLGSRLIKQVSKKFGPVRVYPHGKKDHPSRGFFDRTQMNNVTIDRRHEW